MRRALFALLLVAGLCGCTGLVFHPTREHALTPERIGLDYRDVWLEAADGMRLHGWFLPAKRERLASVLFLHGNAQNISTHIASVAWMPAAGFDVLLIDYRGYGRSEGTPSLEGLHLDVEAALEALLEMPEVDPRRIVVFGQSLGGALAITALAHSRHKEDVRALVVEGAFTSYRALAREKLAGLWLTWPFQWPLALTIDDQYRPIDDIGALAPMPILIIHGQDDPVVPVHHAQALFEAAHRPKALMLVEGAGHIQALVSPEAQRRLVAWLREQLEAGAASARSRERPASLR